MIPSASSSSRSSADVMSNRDLSDGACAAESPHEPLPTGTRVRVVAGAFRGMRGCIEEWQQAPLAMVRIEILGRPVSLTIPAAMLEVVE